MSACGMGDPGPGSRLMAATVMAAQGFDGFRSFLC
jgi:hypothetical protein